MYNYLNYKYIIYKPTFKMKSIIEKPWGSYQVLEEGHKFQVKKITVNPGGKLSLQSHQNRSEHWIIAQGEAMVTINDNIKKYKENEIIFIPAKTKHSLENNNSLTLIVIEMWYGDILDENDIERFEDIYGRI
tara:strand:+ start:227 stop:622 length:396 start_codon:yes stop_codon:yes gene_type:complete